MKNIKITMLAASLALAPAAWGSGSEHAGSQSEHSGHEEGMIHAVGDHHSKKAHGGMAKGHGEMVDKSGHIGLEKIRGSFLGTGTVTKVKDKGGVLVIQHGNINGLMKAMTMPFTMENKKLAKGIKKGDRIEFRLVKGGKWYIVDALRELAPQFYGEGEIVEIKEKGKVFVLDHDDIEGAMDAMTMPFTLKDKKIGKSFEKGDEVKFTLEKDGERFVIVGLEDAE